jgi:hypothetical protein
MNIESRLTRPPYYDIWKCGINAYEKKELSESIYRRAKTPQIPRKWLSPLQKSSRSGSRH